MAQLGHTLATIRERNGSYQAIVRKKGYPPVRKTFTTKLAARSWANQVELDMDRGTWTQVHELRFTNIGAIVDRYIQEVHPVRPFGKSKMATMRLTAREFHDIPISDLTPARIMEYAQRRRNHVSRSTINQELTYLAQAVDMARTMWGLQLQENPVRTTMRVLSQLGITGSSRKRDRRLRPGEYKRLLQAAGDHWIADAIKIAVRSGMRQSEIHALKWDDIDWESNTILIRDRKDPRNKQGNNQQIPLFLGVRNVLSRAYRRRMSGDRVFYARQSASFSDRFALVCKKAGIEDLTFHDLRHEAISRLFERGLSIPQVALVSGHKTWGQLKRYTQLRPSDVLDAAS